MSDGGSRDHLLRTEDDDVVVVELNDGKTPAGVGLPCKVKHKLVLAGNVPRHHHSVVCGVGTVDTDAVEGVEVVEVDHGQVEQAVPVMDLGHVLLQHTLRCEPALALGTVERSLVCSPYRSLWCDHTLSSYCSKLLLDQLLRLLHGCLGSRHLQVGLRQVLDGEGEESLHQNGVVGGEVAEQPVVAEEALTTLGALETERAGHPAVQHQGLLQVDLAKVGPQVGLHGGAEEAGGACEEAFEDVGDGHEDVQLLLVSPGAQEGVECGKKVAKAGRALLHCVTQQIPAVRGHLQRLVN